MTSCVCGTNVKDGVYGGGARGESVGGRGEGRGWERERERERERVCVNVRGEEREMREEHGDGRKGAVL